MKKIVFTVFVLLVFVGVKAQEFGVKVGLNYSNWHTSRDISDLTDPLLRFNAGVFADFELSDRIVLHPELLYSAKGITILLGGEDSRYQQNYLDIPILLSYRINDELSFNIGPEVGFLLSAKATNGTDTIDIKEVFESLEYGLDFGFSYRIPMGLVFDARYNLGLSNIFKEEGSDDDIYNRAFQFSVAYVIPMNGGESATNSIEF
jgi:hypothetical protein